MHLTRRRFLGALAGGAGLAVCSSCERPPLRILILGGTGFVGPHQVREALARGHEVTLFNRGKTAPDMFPELETLIGDRDGELSALSGREWDVVIDNSATIPRWVRRSAELLRGSVGRYLFVSSTGVYYPYRTVDIREDQPLERLEDPDVEEVNAVTFGALKAMAEDEARAAFPNRHLIVRPTYIIGPGDPTDRYSYWPHRLSQGGSVLAPGDPSDPMQHVDVRDLARFMVRLLEQDDGGTFNVAGPEEPFSIGQLLERTRDAIRSEASLVWVDADFLESQGHPFLTYWVSPKDDYMGMMRVNSDRALSAGLTLRTVEETAVDTLTWFQGQGRAPASGLSRERELELLDLFGEGRQ